MNALRNFVVIFFLGIVVFLAGVMVGKSMRGNTGNTELKTADTVVAIPNQVVRVAPPTKDDSNLKESHKPAADEAIALPLPIVSPEIKNSAATGGHNVLSGDETSKPEEEIKYTFYESLTSKKAKTASLSDIPVAKRLVNKKKPVAMLTKTDKTESAGMKGLVLQVASFSHEDKARLFRNALMKEGYGKVVVVAAKISGKGTWYRVQIVDVKDKQTAKLLQERLRKQKSIRSFIAE